MAQSLKDMNMNFQKLDKFEGVGYRRWQKKMHFLVDYFECDVYSFHTHATIPERWRGRVRGDYKEENKVGE